MPEPLRGDIPLKRGCANAIDLPTDVELISLLKKNDIEYDECYLWD